VHVCTTRMVLLIGLFPVAQWCIASPAQAQVKAEAVLGKPFGVGRVELTLPEHMQPEALGLAGLGLSEADGRVLYPTVDTPELAAAVLKEVKGALSQSRRPLGQLLSDLLSPPPKATVYFLFQGDEPLKLTLQSRRAEAFVVRPTSDPAAHGRLMAAWWREYTTRLGSLLSLVQTPDYAPQVEDYLKCMLARRLGFRLPERTAESPSQHPFEQELGLVLGTESIRAAIQRDRMLGRTPGEPADQPLPEPVAVPALQVPDPPEDVQIEPLAARVPAECLYVRFGSFSNFLWFQDTLGRWQDDLVNLITLRGVNYEVKSRIEQSLVLKMSALARLLGDSVVADVAIVGTDVAFQDGAAFGVLFHARNNLLLGAELLRQRVERIQQDDGAAEQKVTIDGREVSLLTSPDGSVRSYYAADGDFHFVTRSRTLMRRFLETGSGKGALGTSKEFRYVRSVMPLDRGDTVFVYLSDAFFRSFVGPHDRVETVRRTQSAADIELVELALLASAAEGKPGESIEELVAGGFLPPEFGARPDGTRTVLADGEVYDSLRGRRGSFVPVPDVDVTHVSPSEAEAYRQFCEFYHANWERLDPIAVGIKRHALEGNRERIVVDARITPFASENYQRLRTQLGPPEPTRLAPVPGDGVALDAVLTSQRVFGGLREIHPPLVGWLNQGIFRGFRDIVVGYVGTTGELGLLSPLNAGIRTPPDEQGYASGPGGMWRRQHGEFTLFSLQPEILAAVAPLLRLEEAQRPAQVRLRVEDLSHARITPMLNNIGYACTRETCLGNLRLMHDLAQQLHVPANDCKDAAELLSDAKLICPLGGEFVFQEVPGGSGFWTSTALSDQAAGGLLTTQAPEGFIAPPLNWFRGLDAELTAMPEALAIHVELVMQMPEIRQETHPD